VRKKLVSSESDVCENIVMR